MEQRWIVRLGLLLTGLLLAGSAGWLLLPQLVNNMPGRWRYYVPQPVVEAVTTPLPPALPTPKGVAVLPTMPPVATLTPTPTTTAVSTQTAVSPTPTPSPTPTNTPDPLPTAVSLDGLQIVPQKFNNCGPTNLAISLNYYGVAHDQFAVAALVRPRYEDRNVTPWELADYVNSQTPLRARVQSGGSLRQIKELLAAGVPVIVEKGLIDEDHGEWLGHYLTLSGYDEQVGVFLTLDTLLGPWEGVGEPLPYAALLPFWQQFNYTFLLVYPPEQETAVSDILGSPNLQTMWTQAAATARADMAAMPANPFAWFNLGSSLSQLAALTGETAVWAEAAAAFDQARRLELPPRMLWYQFQPYEAYRANGRYDDMLVLAEATLISQGGRNVEETYYYQGLALQALGQRDAAALAFKRASQLRPGYTLAEQAAQALNQ